MKGIGERADRLKQGFQSELPVSGCKAAFEGGCRRLVENSSFNVLTTCLTIYALFGDDVRLWVTDKPADPYFDVLTVTALTIFTIECIAASFGKEEYFLSFFFYLDFIATASLILDITTIAEKFYSGDNSYAKSTATGTKSTRVLRLIRLVRIVKLYKTYMDQQQKKKIKAALERKRAREAEEGYSSRVAPGDDEEALLDIDDEEMMMNEESGVHQESRVGKKLSDMTTRRVILLVLTMLLIVPQFQLSEHFKHYQYSTQYGLDLLHVFLRDYEASRDGTISLVDGSTIPPQPADVIAEHKRQYEKELLRYIYTHNPNQSTDHACNAMACANTYLGTLMFIGFHSAAQNSYTFKQNLQRITVVAPEQDQWDKWYNRHSHGFGFDSGPLPIQVQNRLTTNWTLSCKDGEHHLRGVALVKQQHTCPTTVLRYNEVERFAPFLALDNEEKYHCLLVQFDLRRLVRLEATFSIIQTIFICGVLGFCASKFGKDSKELVLIPIERMISKMHRIRDNPLVAMKLGDEEFRKIEIERKRAHELAAAHKSTWRSRLKRAAKPKKKKKVQEPMETVILESTLIKLGGLLAVGFGVAGGEIIGQNMSGTDSSGVNAMVSGCKVEAVFGFCIIQNFSDATEILQDRVMVFVNQVAEIVHSLVDMFGGNANKNIGDAFLMVWKVATVPNDLVDELEDMKAPREHRNKRMRMCDMSIVAFCFTISALNKSAILSDYREHPGFIARFPNYRVQMGFGLHLGFAIEGAIGSEFKIDASYLSPNVNMASRLEAATLQFGVHLLMSHFLMDQCSPKLRDACRQIDRVYVKGSKKPVGLYTCDFASGVLRVVDLMAGIDHKSFTVRRKYEVRQIRELKKNKKWGEDYEAHRELLEDPDIIPMREPYSKEFFQRFGMAFRNYIAGEWIVAREMLTITQCMLITRNAGARHAHILTDSPSVTLLDVMKQYNFEAPPNWEGCRALTSK